MTPNSPLDVDDVILAYLNAVDSGDAPDPSDWLARYPQFAQQLDPFFAVERGFGRVRQPDSTGIGRDTPGPDESDDDSPETLGLGDRYEWGGVLGRGGMGTVVRVRDRTLDRPVAIKILRRRHHASPVMAERFRDEVRIAAGLQHPGVPPVHEVGTAPDGRPFMVMKLIEGSTLAELLRRRPEPSHDLPGFLKIFEQIVQTVAYTHSRGVLHRDLKPHNVMVGAFGEVQVMDWGLARMLTGGGATDSAAGGSWAGSSGRTVAGTVIGTPAYMAPEQARGAVGQPDPRADVFGLGAILCEILTGRPPFAGEHPLDQARRGEVADAQRWLDEAACDRELAALARRCLDPDPAGRPADGRAVADGISGYLASVQERLRQTELAGAKAAAERRRRRAVRGLGSLAAALVVVGLVAVLAVQARANVDLTRKNDDLAAANDRERQRFNLALDAIGLFHGEVSQDLMLKEKQFKPLRTKLLGGAADFYGRLEAQIAGQDDPASQAALARVYTQLGKLHEDLGDRPGAEAAWHKALAIQRRLAAAPDADGETRMAVAATLRWIGTNQTAYDRATAAVTLREAQTVAEVVEADLGATFESRLLVAEIVYIRAYLTLLESRPGEATRLHTQALSIFDSLHSSRPRDPILLRSLGLSHLELAQGMKDTASMRHHEQQALRYYQNLLDLDKTNPTYRHDVAHCHMALGWTNDSAEVSPEVVAANAETARRLESELVAEYSGVTEYQRVLVLACYYAGNQYRLLGEPAKAREALGAGLAHAQHLAATTGEAMYLRHLSRIRLLLAGLDLDDGRLDAALRGAEQAEREMQEVIRREQGDDHRAWLAGTVRRVGLIHLAAGRVPEAAAATRRARDLFTQVWTKVTYAAATPRVELAACHATLAGLAGKPGSGVPAAEGQAEADKAMKLLNTNTSDYYPHPRLLTGDRAFDSLGERLDFQKFLRDGEAIVEKARKDVAR